MTPLERIRGALDLISEYGMIDGSHHKQWLLDQVVRLLTGSDAAYELWVRKQKAGEDGHETYEWDEGIAPWRFDTPRLRDLYGKVTVAIFRAEAEQTRAAWVKVAEIEEAIVAELGDRDSVETDIARRGVISAREKAEKAKR